MPSNPHADPVSKTLADGSLLASDTAKIKAIAAPINGDRTIEQSIAASV